VRYRSEVAEFEIADTGFGIATEDLERIFEPFERGRGAEVRAQPGTGLGGELRVRSTPGEGTTLVVRLFLSRAEYGAPEVRAAQQPIRGYGGRRRHLLLVDDDPAHLALATNLLGPLGFDLATARDGASCLELATAAPPDLVVLDISMPGITGWEVARRLREARPTAEAKILVVSANAHEYTPGGRDGDLHDAFLVKPVDIGLLLDTVGSLLGLQWLREPASPNCEPAGMECAAPAGCAHHLEELYELGQIGHVRGIEAKLNQLEAENPVNRALAAHLRGLVTSFDLKRYMSVIEALRASEPG